MSKEGNPTTPVDTTNEYTCSQCGHVHKQRVSPRICAVVTVRATNGETAQLCHCDFTYADEVLALIESLGRTHRQITIEPPTGHPSSPDYRISAPARYRIGHGDDLLTALRGASITEPEER